MTVVDPETKFLDLPLREVLITTYMSTLTGFTTFARLGMAITVVSKLIMDQEQEKVIYLLRGGPPPGPAI